MSTSILVALLAAFTVPAVVMSQQTCSGGKVYNICGSSCPATCANPTPSFCSLQCVSGCFCPHGMYETSDGRCVALADCPTTPACPGGKVRVTCLNTCPATCDRPNPPLCTSLLCIAGCECPQGTLLHNDTCLTPDQCPSPPPTPAATNAPACTNGKSYNPCGTACPLTCEHPEPRPCTRNCVAGCFCPPDLLEHNGGCVQRSQCPATSAPPTDPVPVCTNNRVYSTCGTACPLTCENHRNPPLICTANCVVGCFCRPGLLQDGDNCVTADQCSDTPTTAAPPATTPAPLCPNGQVYRQCGTACPMRCEDINGPPVACTQQCVPGCFCPAGLVLNGGRCVEPNECPQATPATPTCPPGMTYRDCGPVCRPICGLNLCFSLRCAPGCFCPDRMYEHEGRCISQCPINTEAPPTTTTTEVAVTQPVCSNGKVFSRCASACPVTCQNLYAPPRPCPLYCRVGCTCPNGTVEDGDACVPRTQCRNPCDSVRCASQCVVDVNGRAMCAPDCRVNNGNCSLGQICTRNNYTCRHGSYCDLSRFVTCSAAPVTPTTIPVCPSGMSYNQCGTRCPLTCEYPDPRPCVKICQPGCFCPQGLLQNNGACVRREQCPPPATDAPPTAPVCPSGMSYNQCGTRCPLTCEYPDPRPCVRICQPGCFCPQGLLQNNGACVRREQCPPPATQSPTRPINACMSKTCEDHTRCVVSNRTGEAMCIPTCANNGGCGDQTCEIEVVGCSGDSNSRGPCDYSFFRRCKDAPFVPCSFEDHLACDSPWTYCLRQNVTRRATCVGSCLSRNGYCDENSVCITNVTSTGLPRLQCLQRKDLPTDCPAGQVMNQCGSACQATCDSHLKGPKICPLICGPPACVCPSHLVLFRDRCVDPRLCYILTTSPPAINPLPVVNKQSVLLSMVTTSQMSQEAFDTVQESFLTSVQNTLNSMTNQQLNIRLHGIYFDSSASSNPTLTIVVEVTGDSVSQDHAQTYANILEQNSNLLYIEVSEVQPQEVIYIDTSDEASQGLSNTAIIGIAVGSAVVALCFVSIWIALVACCCMFNRRMTTKASAYQRSPSPSEKPFVFSDMTGEENNYVIEPQDNKGKLIKESLMY